MCPDPSPSPFYAAKRSTRDSPTRLAKPTADKRAQDARYFYSPLRSAQRGVGGQHV